MTIFQFRSVAITCLAYLFSLGVNAQNGLDFDGVNDNVQTSYDGITGTGSRTVEAWIKADFLSTQMVIADYGSMTVGQRFTFNMINGRIRCEIGGNGVTGTTVVGDSTWHHVAVTFDNNASPKYRTYVDGVLEASFNLTVAINTSSATNFRIGRRVDNSNYFIGTIDEVRVWDYARTQSEIAADMFTEFCSVPSGMEAYYKLNEGISGGSNSGVTSTYDASGNGNNGTLNNFALTGAGSNWVAGYPLASTTLTGSVNATGCDGSYTSPTGNVYTTSGNYSDTLQSIAGCDSILTITLDFNSSSSASIAVDECYSYTGPSGTTAWTQTGTYQDTIANAAGCDSVLTIQVNINASYDTINAIGCESYTSPSGSYTWFNTGTYFDTLTNAVGCDSNLFIFLQMEGDEQTNINESGCQSYTSPSGLYTWTSSGTFQDTIAASTGCDSVLTINLDLTSVDTNVNLTGQTLIASAIGAGVTYQWVDCSNDQAIDGATGKQYEPSASGNYAVVISDGNCSDTSACQQVMVVGISSFESAGINIFPNPTKGIVYLDVQDGSGPISVRVFTPGGTMVNVNTFNQARRAQVELPNPAGIYLLEIEQGGQVWRERIIKLD